MNNTFFLMENCLRKSMISFEGRKTMSDNFISSIISLLFQNSFSYEGNVNYLIQLNWSSENVLFKQLEENVIIFNNKSCIILALSYPAWRSDLRTSLFCTGKK